MRELCWEPEWSYKDYIAQIHAEFPASQARGVEGSASSLKPDAMLCIDELFLNQFFRLNKNAAIKVTDALQHAPFESLIFGSFDMNPMPRRHRQPYQRHRFQKLCRALGTIKSLTYAAVAYRQGMGTFGGVLLRNLSQVKSVFLGAGGDTLGTRDLPLILKGLHSQRSLENIIISAPSHYYRTIAPELLLMTEQLKKVKIFGGYRSAQVSTIDTQALMQLFTGSDALPMHVEMRNLNFSDAKTHAYLCKALPQMKCEFLVIDGWLMNDPAMVANALAQSAVKNLCVSLRETEEDPSSPSFFVGLGNGLGPTSRLEELKCTLYPDRSAPRDHDECLIAVAQGAAHCRNLKRLKLVDLGIVASGADEALATCIVKNSSLLELEVTCRMYAVGAEEDIQLPRLYEAMKSNVTLQHIRLYSAVIGDSYPWDPEFKRELEAIVAMNRMGRSYLKSDPANKAAGIKLLEQVIDDSGCLFFHLRENPLLCCQEP